MLIFKGKLKGNKQKKLQSHPLLINKKIFAIYQDNSWADHQCFMIWLEEIFFKYINKIKTNTKRILISIELLLILKKFWLININQIIAHIY